MKRSSAVIIGLSTVVTLLGAFTQPAMATKGPACGPGWHQICAPDPWVDCFDEEEADAICSTACPDYTATFSYCWEVGCFPDAGAMCFFT